MPQPGKAHDAPMPPLLRLSRAPLFCAGHGLREINMRIKMTDNKTVSIGEASRPKAALPPAPITSFVAAAAFASEPFTDDTFAAFQQGVRFAERVHGVSNGTE